MYVCRPYVESSAFLNSWSPGFPNICGRTLHHLHHSANRQGGWEQRRVFLMVALAPLQRCDLPLRYRFQTHMQNSSLGNLAGPPPSSLSLPFFSFLLPFSLLVHPASHLSVSSGSLLTFSILKSFEADSSHEIPSPLLGLNSESFSSLSIFHLTVSSILQHSPYSTPILPNSLYSFCPWRDCFCSKNSFLDRTEGNPPLPNSPCRLPPFFPLFS